MKKGTLFKTILLLLLLIKLALPQIEQLSQEYSNNYWFLIQSEDGNSFAYINSNGDTVIPFNRYQICYTDTFKTGAIVFQDSIGLVAIDKKENVLFHVFAIDNGPDYPSYGLFRIIENELIGYSDMNFNVVIKPQFKCAFPFENGTAKVSLDCNEITDGEYKKWNSDSWFFIDTAGNKIETE